MSRELNEEVIAAIRLGTMRPAILIEASFPEKVKRIWNGYGQIQWGGLSWEGKGEIKGLSSLLETVDSAAQGVKMTCQLFEDEDGILDIVFEGDHSGSQVTFYLTFFNIETNQLIDPVVDESEFLDDEDETVTWKAAVEAAGSGWRPEDAEACNQLISQMKSEGYFSHFVYLLPFLGDSLPAAMVPLIDRDAAGNSTNTGFVGEDFDRIRGLTKNDNDKFLTTPIHIQDLNANTTGGLKGGIGSYALFLPGNATCHFVSVNGGGENLYLLLVSSTSNQVGRLYWGYSASDPSWTPDTPSPVPPGAAHLYGQSSAGWGGRSLYLDGELEASRSSTKDAADLSGSSEPFLFFARTSTPPSSGIHRSGCMYLTDGQLTDDEIEHFHILLETWLGDFRRGNLGTGPFVWWKGRIDFDEVEVGGTDSSLTLFAESSMVTHLRKRVSRWTYADQQRLYPDTQDTALTRIEKIQENAIPWGRSL